VMQTGIAPSPLAATSAAIPVSAQAQAPTAAKKGGWNSGYTAVAAIAAAVIILAVVSYARKGSFTTVAQVNAPSASSQNSPLGSPQAAAPAPSASVPDDLMKAGTASDPSTASPVPGGGTPSTAMKAVPTATKPGTPVPSVAVTAPGAKVTVSPNGGVQVNAGGTTVSVPAQQAPPNMSGMSAAEVEELEHNIDQLSSRAAAINNSLDHLQKQQEAAGYGLRGDMVAAQASMKTNLAKAQSAMEHGDPVKAKKYAELASASADTLDQFLGR
jgi:hypothetical protein